MGSTPESTEDRVGSTAGTAGTAETGGMRCYMESTPDIPEERCCR